MGKTLRRQRSRIEFPFNASKSAGKRFDVFSNGIISDSGEPTRKFARTTASKDYLSSFIPTKETETIMKLVKFALALLASFTFGSSVWNTQNVLNAQNVIVGSPVPQDQQVSIDQISHGTFNELLQRYVNANGQVNYQAWKNSGESTRALDSYLAHLSRANPQFQSGRANQLAFWINAYNALTIKGILDVYPTTSIRNHTSETGGYNIWKTLFLPVGNQQINLDSIEHQVLRKMNEPRIHFAIVCASHSCPQLHVRAYDPQHIEAQLSYNTSKFFANPENFRWDPASRTFQMSSIIQWFGSDFGATQAEQLRYLAPYLPVEAQAAAQQNAGAISFLPYNWDLNEIRGPLPQATLQQTGAPSQMINGQGSGTVIHDGAFQPQGSGTR